MKSLLGGLCGFALVLTSTANLAPAQEADEVMQRFRMNPYHTNLGTVAKVDRRGAVEVTKLANPLFALRRGVAGQSDLSEGAYLGLVAKEFVLSTKDTRVVRLEVTEVGPDGAATIQVSSDAASSIKPGEQIVIFRPPGSTTAELKSAPDFAPVDDGTKTSVLGKDAANSAAMLTQSRNNLKQIGLAMHNFEDTYRHFPPAVVYGPDGKPWHSWRVFILPFVDEAALYNEYHFNEPWDGPNNKKLLARMPAVFRDPIYGQSDDYYTHYAAVTGDGTAFPTEGVTMDDADQSPLENVNEDSGVSRIRDFTDGTSNSLMVGPAGPEHKIPWMKPEDVAVGEDFPALGEKGSFAAPYEGQGKRGGVFLFADGSVRTLGTDVDQETFLNLLHIGDGNVIGEFATLDQPAPRKGVSAAHFIEIIRTKEGVRARLVAGEE